MTQYSPEFIEFWKRYPARYIPSSGRHVKLNKFKAWKVWKGMSLGDKRDAWRYANRKGSEKFVPDAFRWLRDKCWEDYMEDEPFVPSAASQMAAKALKEVPRAKSRREIGLEKNRQLDLLGE